MARTPYTTKQNTGRSPKYNELFAHQAYLLCQQHAYADQQLADALDVSLATLQAWKEEYAPFREAIQAGTEVSDKERGESALLRRATGFVRRKVTTKTIRRNGQEYIETVEVREEIPGDLRAQISWLTKYDPEHWKRLPQTGQAAESDEGNAGGLVVPEPEDPDIWLQRAQPQDP